MLRFATTKWERIREQFPEAHIPEGRPGRKPVPAPAILEAVLWILNTGAQWPMLPQCHPNYKTGHRRFQQWCEREILRDMFTQLANTLREQGAMTSARASSMRRLPRLRVAAAASVQPAVAKASSFSRLGIAMGSRSR